MKRNDWKLFYEKNHGQEIVVCRIKPRHALALSNGYRAVIIHHDVVKKAVEKHELPFEVFPEIEDAIFHGSAYKDIRSKNKVISFFYFAKSIEHWIQVSVKRCTSEPEFYVSTLFRVKEKNIIKRKSQWPKV